MAVDDKLLLAAPAEEAMEVSDGREIPPTPRLRLHEVELRGFKSFGGEVRVGPLHDFTCVIGPNGQGKSVLGEAIAFVLGGSKRMLRAKTNATLVNQQALAADPRAAATVVLTFHVLEPDSAEAGTLALSKTVSSSGTSLRMRSPGSDVLRRITQAELCAELEKYGIQTSFTDRFIVAQNRAAVSVEDPGQLLLHLEALVGTDVFQQRIEEVSKDLAATRDAADGTAAAMERAETTRAALEPEVHKWRQYEADLAGFETRRADFLRCQSKALALKVVQAESQSARAAEALAAAQAEAHELASKSAGASSSRASRAAALQIAKEQCQSLTKQVNQLQLQQTRLAVRLQAAEEEEKRAQATAKRMAQKGSRLRKQHAALREEELQAQLQVEDLQTSEKKVAAKLERLRCGSGSGASKELLHAVEQAKAELSSAEGKLQSMELEASEHAAGEGDRAARVAALQVSVARAQAEVMAQKVKEGKSREQVAAAEKALAGAASTVATSEAGLMASKQALASIQAQCQESQQQLNAAQQPPDTASAGALDTAVEYFRRQSAQGHLPGHFMGRLRDVARVSSASALTAVNAVLNELCNLASTLVVENRETASLVLHHFRAERVGIATCKIIDELQQHRSSDTLLGGDEQTVPLVALIHVSTPRAQPVFHGMLHNWFLVNDCQTAVKVSAADRAGKFAPRNLVTRAGEIFKADGEVVGRGGVRPGLRPYLLTSEATSPAEPGVQQGRAASKEDVSELHQQMAQLEARQAAAAKEVDTMARQLEGQRLGMRQFEAALQRAQAAAAAASRRRAGRGAAEQKLTALEAQLTEAKEMAAQEERAGGSADLEELAAQRSQVKLLQARYGEARAAADGGPARFEAELDLQLLRRQIATADEVRQRAGSARERLQRQLAQQEVDPGRCVDAAAQGLQKLQVELGKLVQEAEGAAGALAAAKDAAQAAEASVAAATEKARAASRASNVAAAKQARAERAAGSTTARLQRLREQRAKVAAALAALPGDAATVDAVTRQTKKRENSSLRCPSGSRTIVESSDSDAEPAEGAGGGSSSERSGEDSDGDQGAAAAAAQLAEEEQALQERRAAINGDALERDLECAVRLEEAAAQLDQQQQAIGRLEADKERLQRERYAKFHAALGAVNGQLSACYRRLTGQQGDAYLSWTQERLLCFEDGVTLNIRPDRHKWRPFRVLSGGQQALATLALSFALQAAFPSPFYFFDEIDCALDTANTGRVADFIRHQGGAQFIVVSHKPQMYERADCLVGVYARGDTSAAVLWAPSSTAV